MDQRSITLRIDGVDYVAVPAAEYRKLRGETVDAVAWTRATLGSSLRKAREAAGLTQGALAKKLKRSQTMIARSESGDMRVSERYVKTVLKACKLPANWSAGE
jgi:ribosome-binding protein aMBF1 (putative translation factor)